jgi:hypothetical protein
VQTIADEGICRVSRKQATILPGNCMIVRIFFTGGKFDKEYGGVEGRLCFRDTHLQGCSNWAGAGSRWTSVSGRAVSWRKTGSGWFREPVSLNTLQADECYLVTLTRVTGPNRPEGSNGESAL